MKIPKQVRGPWKQYRSLLKIQQRQELKALGEITKLRDHVARLQTRIDHKCAAHADMIINQRIEVAGAVKLLRDACTGTTVTVGELMLSTMRTPK